MYYRGSAAAIIVYDITKEVFTFSPDLTLGYKGKNEHITQNVALVL